jgi:hypothetical protein
MSKRIDLKLEPEDFNRAVKIELSVDELSYIQQLFGCEMVFQIRNFLTQEMDISEKVVKILSAFESYRILDDQILDFMFAMNQYKKELKNKDTQYKGLLIVGKHVCKLYNTLVHETVKMKLPEEVEKLKLQLNDTLINKIDLALQNSFDIKDMNNTQPTPAQKEKTPKFSKEDLNGINIFTKTKVMA